MMRMLRQLWQGVEGLSAWLRMVAVLVAFTIVIGGMIWQRMRLLQTGREVIVPMRPVDPRDLFRGHYALLNYDFSRIETSRVRDFDQLRNNGGRSAFSPSGTIFVVLRKDPARPPFWAFSHALLKPPEKLGREEVFLRCKRSWFGARAIFVNCGIERFYAPKERALKLERELRGRWRFDRNRGRMVPEEGARVPGVILRVNARGEAAIAGLYVDGKRILVDGLL